MNEFDIVCVATTPDRVLAQSWREMLEGVGIPCQVGESLTFWMDNNSCSLADLWVPRFEAHRARELLEGVLPGVSVEPEAVYQY